MEAVKGRKRLARAVSKVLHRTNTNSIDDVKKPLEYIKDEKNLNNCISKWLDSFEKAEDEVQKTLALEALAAELFARISSIKAAYANLQLSQTPYNSAGIQSADKTIVSEFRKLTELKQLFVKEQLDFHPETTLAKAEVHELKSVVQTYNIISKRMDSQMKLKDSEILYLKEKLAENLSQNDHLEKSTQISPLDNRVLHFIAYVQHTVKSIRSFVKVMIEEMKNAGWDLDVAADCIAPGVLFWRADDKCFAFEAFVCREMFAAFNFPFFSVSAGSHPPASFLKRFSEMKTQKARDYLLRNPRSSFAKFCRAKFLKLIHPKMETYLFDGRNNRDVVAAGGFPENSFFAAFAEMGKRVWLLHCLAFSFQPEASIFEVRNGCRFSEVYMECAVDESMIPTETDPPVAFTVVPGFRVDGMVLQCQVYLAPMRR